GTHNIFLNHDFSGFLFFVVSPSLDAAAMEDMRSGGAAARQDQFLQPPHPLSHQQPLFMDLAALDTSVHGSLGAFASTQRASGPSIFDAGPLSSFLSDANGHAPFLAGPNGIGFGAPPTGGSGGDGGADGNGNSGGSSGADTAAAAVPHGVGSGLDAAKNSIALAGQADEVNGGASAAGRQLQMPYPQFLHLAGGIAPWGMPGMQIGLQPPMAEPGMPSAAATVGGAVRAGAVRAGAAAAGMPGAAGVLPLHHLPFGHHPHLTHHHQQQLHYP
ncbi:unnamed protein product, partial [Phaeothamnion confervicola]